MSSLLAVISPAKLLDDQIHYPDLKCSQPVFIKEAESLVQLLRKLDLKTLQNLLDASPAIAQESMQRFQGWKKPFTHQNAFPAILMFRGEVYRGMQAVEFSAKELQFAHENLRILSGIYGVMRPLDLVMPYRLMMGTPIKISPTIKNLYQFWEEKITSEIKLSLDKKGILLNLASDEYFKAINLKTLDRRVIHCEFKEKKGDKYVVTSTYAKLARGKMARFFIENEIAHPEDLRAFEVDNYAYNAKLSNSEHFVFTRG